jgi:hypothetical protein
VKVAELNVQNQQKFSWPTNYVVAKAYIDQLNRSNSLDAKKVAALNDAIAKAEASPKGAAKLRGMAAGLDKDASTAKTPADASRLHALAGIMKQGGTAASTTAKGTE